MDLQTMAEMIPGDSLTKYTITPIDRTQVMMSVIYSIMYGRRSFNYIGEGVSESGLINIIYPPITQSRLSVIILSLPQVPEGEPRVPQIRAQNNFKVWRRRNYLINPDVV